MKHAPAAQPVRSNYAPALPLVQIGKKWPQEGRTHTHALKARENGPLPPQVSVLTPSPSMCESRPPDLHTLSRESHHDTERPCEPDRVFREQGQGNNEPSEAFQEGFREEVTSEMGSGREGRQREARAANPREKKELRNREIQRGWRLKILEQWQRGDGRSGD